MIYEPNFYDPRVIKRIKKAIGFTKAMIPSHKTKEISSLLIDKHFGMANNPLSRYLRETILICTDEHYNFGAYGSKCKGYVSNTSGMSFLVEAVNQSSRVPVLSSGVNKIPMKGEGTGGGKDHIIIQVYDQAMEWAKETYKEQLETLEFQYEEKSSRDINPIQSIRNETRRPLLAQYGLKHQYDVKTCAPTLLYQHSFMVPDATGVVLQTLEHYLDNTDAIRLKIATEADMTLSQSKETITSLFAGAVLSRYPDSSIMKRLNGDVGKVQFLQQHPYLISLRMDIKEMWDTIKTSVPPSYMIDKNGNKRKRAFNPRAKWNIYFQLERKVMHCCYAYLESKDNKYFNEHDGFTSQKEVDLKELSQFIQHNTGFNLTFEKKI